MSKLLAALISSSLMLACVNVYADETTMKNDATFKLAMDNSMKQERMSSPVGMGGAKKGAAKKNKKHHKRVMKKHGTK